MTAAGMKQVSKDDLKNVAASQGNLFIRFIKVVSEIFLPIIPVLVGSGLLMALNNILTAPKIFDAEKSLIEMYHAWKAS